MTNPNREEILKALKEVTAEAYKTTIELLMLLGEQDELNYVRTPVHMPNGSEYIYALLHVGGPVLSLKKLREGGYGEFLDGSVENPIASGKRED